VLSSFDSRTMANLYTNVVNEALGNASGLHDTR
jgi:hypothetical protein